MNDPLLSLTVSRKKALGLVAAPALTALAATVASGDELTSIKVSTSYSDSYAEAFYAQDGGFFKRFGLTAELQIFGNGSQTLTAVVTGNADIGATNPVALAQAVQRGLPVTCFAGDGIYSSNAPTTALFVTSNAPYRKAKDLEGQTIALLSIKDVTFAAVRDWLVQNGADPTKVKFIEIPASEMAVALQRGIVAAVNMPEPYIAAARKDIRLFGKTFDAIAKTFLISVWVAQPSYIEKNKTIVERFVSAVYATANWANTHHDATAPILAKYAKMKPALIRSMTRASFADSLDARDLQSQFDLAYKNKLIQAPVKAADVITHL